MNFACLSELNGLGLLGKPINKIREDNDNIETPSDAYENLLENRKKFDDNLNIQKANSIEDIKPQMTPYARFINEQYDLIDKPPDSVRIIELKKRIITIDRALNIILEDYRKNYTEFMESIQQFDKEQLATLNEMDLYNQAVIEFVQRLNNTSIVIPH